MESETKPMYISYRDSSLVDNNYDMLMDGKIGLE